MVSEKTERSLGNTEPGGEQRLCPRNLFSRLSWSFFRVGGWIFLCFQSTMEGTVNAGRPITEWDAGERGGKAAGSLIGRESQVISGGGKLWILPTHTYTTHRAQAVWRDFISPFECFTVRQASTDRKWRENANKPLLTSQSFSKKSHQNVTHLIFNGNKHREIHIYLEKSKQLLSMNY